MSTFFHRPRKSYYSRVFIPKNLLPFFNGRIECWKALRTPELSTAKLRSSAWEAQGRRLFRTLGYRGHTMTTAQIEAMIAGWIEAELEADENLRADGPSLSDEERDGMTGILGDQLEETWGALVGNDLTSV